MEDKEFKSFFKTVGGNEGSKCHYPTRLDTYGCGCQHDCKYCYAKSLLEFRGFWNAEHPSVASLKKIENKVKKLPPHTVLRLGGMTDCFMPMEAEKRVTYETIKILNKYDIEYLIVTKSNLVARDDYMEVMRKDLAHIQITVTTTDDHLSTTYEKACVPSERIKAIEKLQANGFDVAIRLSPYMEELVDVNKINEIKCDKIIVEFLRANYFIKKLFDKVDYSKYTLKQGQYSNLPLEEKIRMLNKIKIKQISVCEDVTEHYEYWNKNVNYNCNDCCNLRNSKVGK